MPLPSMWRVDLLHPMFVHFPLGLLLIGTVTRVAAVFLVHRFAFLLPAGRWMLAWGTVGAWAAFVSGNWAEEVVNRDVCDPTATHFHGELALWASLLFTFLTVADLGWASREWRRPPWAECAFCLALLIAAGVLIWTGHLGAALVYQQAAGVYRPSDACTEFE